MKNTIIYFRVFIVDIAVSAKIKKRSEKGSELPCVCENQKRSEKRSEKK